MTASPPPNLKVRAPAAAGGHRRRRATRLVVAVGSAVLGVTVAVGGLAGSAVEPAAAWGPAIPGMAAPAIDADVRAAMLAEPTRPISVMLVLDAAVAPGAPATDTTSEGRQLHRAARVAAWRRALTDAAAPLRERVARERRAGRVTRADDLWLADALVLTATPDVVWDLARHPAVRRVAREPVLLADPPGGDRDAPVVRADSPPGAPSAPPRSGSRDAPTRAARSAARPPRSGTSGPFTPTTSGGAWGSTAPA